MYKDLTHCLYGALVINSLIAIWTEEEMQNAKLMRPQVFVYIVCHAHTQPINDVFDTNFFCEYVYVVADLANWTPSFNFLITTLAIWERRNKKHELSHAHNLAHPIKRYTIFAQNQQKCHHQLLIVQLLWRARVQYSPKWILNISTDVCVSYHNRT